MQPDRLPPPRVNVSSCPAFHFENASPAELTGLFNTAPDSPAYRPQVTSCRPQVTPFNRLLRTVLATALAFATVVVIAGCDQPPPIRQYTIDTEMPATLRSQDRMLGAIMAQDSAVWFFKLVGPTEAVTSAEPELKAFLQQLEFVEGRPKLEPLPESWRRSGAGEMRFDTLLIPTPTRELELSVSSLPKSGQWTQQVAMNVNRWRGQMGLSDSEEAWAGAELLESDPSADEPAVWVDLTGKMGPGPPPMSSMTGAASPATGQLPPGHPEIPAAGGSSDSSRPAAASSGNPTRPAAGSAENTGGLKYEAPADWRQGTMSAMRLAAFEFGSEDRPVTLTIIQAGGDVRGNVDRWLGQVRGDSPPAEVVDEALQDAQQLRVSGHEAQRFFLTAGSDSAADAEAIDATIVPLESGMSLFIKATGPQTTLVEQRAAIAQFLESLKLPD